jgi:ATP-dependent Lon protease
MLPARNRKDLEDVPDAAREHVRFVWLERVEDAIAAALEPAEERGAERQSASFASTEKRAARSA